MTGLMNRAGRDLPVVREYKIENVQSATADLPLDLAKCPDAELLSRSTLRQHRVTAHAADFHGASEIAPEMRPQAW
jgi:hypothetical protein